MIAIIRIAGQTDLRWDVIDTLNRLRIHRKLACTLIDEKDKVMFGMLKAIDKYVTYGEIDDALIRKLILARGQTLDGKKINEKDVDKILEGIKKGDWKIKKFFRLHPPIKGFRKSTKMPVPQGILGKNKDIAKLLEKML